MKKFPLYPAIEKRIKLISNNKKGTTERVFAFIELFCIPISFLTLLLLIAQSILKISGYELSQMVPAWVLIYLKPILSAAAIGYITNWLAIQMLFRPYHKKNWLIIWQQGLLPKNQAKIAHTIADSVVGQLLKPEALVNEFNDKIKAYLGRPEVLDNIKSKAINLAEKYGKSWISAAFSIMGKGFEKILAENITPDTIYSVWDNYLEPKLQNEETRAFVVQKVVDTLQEVSPELSSQIRKALQQFLEQKLQKVPETFGLKEKIVNAVLNWADDDSINQVIVDALGKPEAIEKIKQLFIHVANKGNEWLRSDDTRKKLSGYSSEIKDKILALVQNYLEENADQIVLSIINSQKLWDWLANTGRPYLQENLSAYINEHKQDILDNLQLDQRIETAINKMNAEEFHAMLDRLAAEHLGAIQVLGFILGGLVGALQTL